MTDLILELASVAKKISKYWNQLANPDAVDGYSLSCGARSKIASSLPPAPKSRKPSLSSLPDARSRRTRLKTKRPISG
jgi:hypothetical protein